MAELRYRIWRFLTPFLVSVAFAAALAVLLGAYQYNAARDGLARDMARAQSYLDAFDIEVLAMRSALAFQGAASCTPEALQVLRELELNSQYFVDIAVMNAAGTDVECTTTRGVTENLKSLDTPVEIQLFANSEPVALHLNGGGILGPDAPALSLRLEGYFLTVNERLLQTETLSTSEMTFIIRQGARFSPLIGSLSNEDMRDLTITELGSGLLREVACSPEADLCVFGTRNPETLKEGAGLLLALALVLGTVLGVGSTVLVRRYVERQSSLHGKLLRAIAAEELFVTYQPIIDLNTGEVKSAEALVRWIDRDGQMIPPDIFCSIAENAGFSNLLTDFVIAYTIRNFWTRPEMRSLSVAFNVAPGEILADDFIERHTQKLRGAGIPIDQAKFEITERMSVDLVVFEHAVERVTSAGFKVVLDDFGTGQAGFPYLRRLNLDAIKIDRSFVASVGEDNAFGRMLPHMVDMIMALGIDVVVEGLEEEHQRDWFRERGNLLAQGYFYSRPVKAPEFADFLASLESMRWVPTAPVARLTEREAESA